MSTVNPHPLQVKTKRGQVIGVVVSGIFRKDKVYGSRHMMRRPHGWALDAASLAQAEGYGADLVQLTDQETGSVYRASISLIKEKGLQINRGYGRQICLPLEFWEVDSNVHPVSSAAVITSSAVQLALFDGSEQ